VAATSPQLVVIDSIQAMAGTPGLSAQAGASGGAGSVAQVRHCAGRLVALAKAREVPMVLVGHVTKDGSLAGPRALEHLVDTVLTFEGDRHHALRLLSAVKHRFGPTGELGLFEMDDQGLNRVDDPGRLLLSDRLAGVPGGVVLPSLQGRRSVVVELQALVTAMTQAQAKRSVVGLDSGRLTMTLAVLVRHADLPVLSKDVFASVAGGIRVSEPAADLAVALAVASAMTGVALPADLAAFGEIGLSGEVRQVTNTERRLEELGRLGFRRVVVPASSPEGPSGVELVRVATVAEAVALMGCLPDADERGTPTRH
jgi:DNA repair protein RadA/Sms